MGGFPPTSRAQTIGELDDHNNNWGFNPQLPRQISTYEHPQQILDQSVFKTLAKLVYTVFQASGSLVRFFQILAACTVEARLPYAIRV